MLLFVIHDAHFKPEIPFTYFQALGRDFKHSVKVAAYSVLFNFNIGLIIEPGIWRVLNNFASGSVCLVLASDLFAEEDYIRDYNQFLVSKGITTHNHE